MARTCRGIRGATTAASNSSDAILAATRELLERIVAANGVRSEDIASVIFSTTPDLDAEFPARAARDLGWDDVAVLCTHEMSVPGALSGCIRVLIHWNTERRADEIRHVYLREARRLRPDRAGPLDGAGASPLDDTRPPGRPAADRAAVLGLGLIGASLAGALRHAGAAKRLTGHDLDPDTARRAVAAGFVDRVADDPADAVADADLVILAAPVRAILELLDRIAPRLRPGTLVLDTGSTKRRIVERMNRLPEEVLAVGGHPMCGKEGAGIGHADPALFRGATFALAATERTDEAARERAERLAESVGARPLWIDAALHDAAAAAISHLPYLLSIALVESAFGAAAPGEPADAAARLAASGFRDVSRLAASDDRMMRDILATNADAVHRMVQRATQALSELGALVDGGDERRLAARLSAAAERRRAWMPLSRAGR